MRMTSEMDSNPQQAEILNSMPRIHEYMRFFFSLVDRRLRLMQGTGYLHQGTEKAEVEVEVEVEARIYDL